MRIAVVGAGVVGLSTTASLLARGAEVVCYERSATAMGERSAGSSRIFRLAHSYPDLVRLARSAREGFRRWEEAAGTAMVGADGCVVSGPDIAGWADAMRAADAPAAMVDGGSEQIALPAVVRPAALLVDPAGGVIHVDAIRAHLTALTRSAVVHEVVYALEPGPAGAAVCSPSGTARFDAVVVAAGAATSPLAAQVGVYTPSALAHHTRFTFPVDPGSTAATAADRSSAWPCWIDKPPSGLSTYQHRSGPGLWSVGGSVDPGLTAWEVGPEAAAAASRAAVLDRVTQHLTVQPRIVDSLYCAETPGLGDGFTVLRTGAILVVYGENLFKLAPVLGRVLAAAALDGSTPSVGEAAAATASSPLRPA